MKYKFRCSCCLFSDGQMYRSCDFLDENGEVTYKPRVCAYLVHTLESDIYLPEVRAEHLALVEQAEKNPQEVYAGGGQGFSLGISAQGVTIYCNEFDAEDGWPDLSCSLKTFKSVLVAWNAFLQLPYDIHSLVEVEVEVEEIKLPEN